MKIEFIEERIIDGDGERIRYSVEVDGRYVSNSVSGDKDKGYIIFKTLVDSKGAKCDKNIIETVDV